MNLIIEKLRIFSFRNLFEIAAKAQKDMIFIHAASLTYSTFLSFIPIVALAYYFFDFIGGFEQLHGDTQNFIRSNLAPQFADEILTYLEIIRIRVNPKAMGVFGVVGFIVSGILLLSKIEFSLNSMWNFNKTRPWVQKLTTYWTLLSLGPIFIGFSILTARQALQELSTSDSFMSYGVAGLLAVFPYVTSALFLTALYLWMPAIRIPWKVAMVGGIVGAVLFEVLKQVYALYALYALKNSIYGTLAVIPIFLVWINLLWVVILLGAQFCYFFQEKQIIKK